MKRQPQRAIRHRSETAGHLATTHVPIVPGSANVGSVRMHLQRGDYECIDLILVIDEDGHYQGAVELRRFLTAEDDQPLSQLVNARWPTVPPELDQEHAAEFAGATSVSVLPVVAAGGVPIGLLTANVLLDVLSREHREDMDRLVGVLRERAGARHALEDPPLRRVARRLPWLMVGLALSTAATAVMASFERALQSDVMIAFFIPAIVYLTDAIGTQTEAIAVRGLSVRKKPLLELLWREVQVGGMIGLVLGAIAVAAIWPVFGQAWMAFGVGISLLVAGTVASGLGLALPWLLSRLGADPAFGAGPVATIVQDVLTIIVYFVVMTRLIALQS